MRTPTLFAVAADRFLQNRIKLLAEDGDAVFYPFSDCLSAENALKDRAPDALLAVLSQSGGEADLMKSAKEKNPACKTALIVPSRAAEDAAPYADAVYLLPKTKNGFYDIISSLLQKSGRRSVRYEDVSDVLLSLGIDPSSVAFAFLVRMVTAASECDGACRLCDLYRSAAAEISGYSESAEASARSAVKKAYSENAAVFAALGFTSRPKLGPFIYRIMREAGEKKHE